MENKEKTVFEEIKAYKTTDNNIFENENDAEKYQLQINFEDGLRVLIEKHIPYYDNKVMVFNFIDEHKKIIYNLLKEFL